MATQTNLLSIRRLRFEAGTYGHAMPCDWVKLLLNGGAIGKFSGPVFVFAQGSNMPISRGSPPTP